jgi:hypothetical protein
MKNIHFLFIIIPFLFSCQFVQGQKKTVTAEVNFLSESTGIITVRSIGYGKNKAEAIDNAEINAMDVLLFRGLPESTQKDPIIGINSDEIKSKNKEYFENFYGAKQYKTFIMSALPTTEDLIKNKGGKKSIAVDVKINVKALRLDLENKNIIRKFGF